MEGVSNLLQSIRGGRVMGVVTQTWTVLEKKTLMDMIERGHTAAEVARELGRTRAAVIGYCHRNEIRFTHMIKKAKTTPTIKRVIQKPIPLPKPPKEFFVFLETEFKTFDEISSMDCKSVIGDAKGVETKYCGRPVMKVGCAWCEDHYALYYTNRKAERNEPKQNYSRNDRFFARFKL
jgi:hypothetical protein